MIRKVSEIVEQLKNPEYTGYEEEIISLYAKEIINECGEIAQRIAYPGTEEMVYTVVTTNVRNQLI